MEPKIIDAHTHVHFPEFDTDRKAVIERARQAGVGMITVGTDISLTRKAISTAHGHEYVWATAGLHPHEAKRYGSRDEMGKEIKELEELAHNEKVVGIGECGIDLFRGDDRRALGMQKELFVAQLELAHRLQKPIVIHSRGSTIGALDGLEMILDVLGNHEDLLLPEAGVCHFFTGTVEIADRFITLGFSFTFGGLITFNRAFDDVVRHVPPERILVETDAPFVAPASHRGQRNEPLYISEVVTALAGVRGESEEETKARTLENTLRLFKLPHRP